MMIDDLNSGKSGGAIAPSDPPIPTPLIATKPPYLSSTASYAPDWNDYVLIIYTMTLANIIIGIYTICVLCQELHHKLSKQE